MKNDEKSVPAWSNDAKSFVLCMYAKGVPFDVIAKHSKPARTREQVVELFNAIASGTVEYTTKINRFNQHFPWTAKEIKLLRWMKAQNVRTFRCAQVLCRPKKQVAAMWDRIKAPII